MFHILGIGIAKVTGVQKWIDRSSIPESIWHYGKPNISGDRTV